MDSAYETIQYDTIDKQNQVLVTLPSLFKDKNYIDIIIRSIKEQMEEDSSKVYFMETSD